MMTKTRTVLGKWTEHQLDDFLLESAATADIAARIDRISAAFLDTPYLGSTLIGDADTREVFMINLEWVDCFTLIDQVEAMRLSRSFAEFTERLKRIRYRNGEVSFTNRNHFFSDWIRNNADSVRDVTRELGGDTASPITKILNRKENSSLFIEGLPPKERRLSYISGEYLNEQLFSRMKTGDYIGVYSPLPGLDVSHTGILIRNGDTLLFRHASSDAGARKVVDQDFRSYMQNKPGIIILRPW